MVIDFHVHCFPDEVSKKAVSVLAQNCGVPNLLDGTVGDIKRSMKNAGVDRSVVLSIATKPSQTEKINNWSQEIQDGDIIAFGSIHPDFDNWRMELKRIKDLGLKGVKFHPDYQLFYVDDQKLFPLYELILELGLIMVFHAGIDIGLPPPYHCTPERLKKVIKTFPNAKIVAAHMGGYSYWNEVESLLVGEDIYFDTSYSLGIMGDEQTRRIIKNHGYKRILFGTDSPWKGQDDEIKRLKGLGLGEDAEKAILGENAKVLLGL